MAHKTIKQATERLELIKGSRFLAFVTPIEALTDIKLHLDHNRKKHADASHHCYAYRLADQIRFSDDGEPSGTAGRPMLEILQKRDLDFSLGIVTRYFGGTKLGAGGLVRAYSGSLAKALDEAGEFYIKDRASLKLSIPFQHMDTIHRHLNSIAELHKEETTYTATGLELTISLLKEDNAALLKDLQNLSRGEVTVDILTT